MCDLQQSDREGTPNQRALVSKGSCTPSSDKKSVSRDSAWTVAFGIVAKSAAICSSGSSDQSIHGTRGSSGKRWESPNGTHMPCDDWVVYWIGRRSREQREIETDKVFLSRRKEIRQILSVSFFSVKNREGWKSGQVEGNIYIKTRQKLSRWDKEMIERKREEGSTSRRLHLDVETFASLRWSSILFTIPISFFFYCFSFRWFRAWERIAHQLRQRNDGSSRKRVREKISSNCLENRAFFNIFFSLSIYIFLLYHFFVFHNLGLVDEISPKYIYIYSSMYLYIYIFAGIKIHFGTFSSLGGCRWWMYKKHSLLLRVICNV